MEDPFRDRLLELLPEINWIEDEVHPRGRSKMPCVCHGT